MKIRLLAFAFALLFSSPAFAANPTQREILDRGWGKPGQHQQHEGDPRQYIISGSPQAPAVRESHHRTQLPCKP